MDSRTYEEIARELQALSEQYAIVQQSISTAYTHLVNGVCCGQISDDRSIQAIMDSLPDYGDIPECLAVYKRLCRFEYERHPRTSGNFDALFRLLFMEKSDSTDWPSEIFPCLQELIEQVRRAYKDDLEEVVLFGSYARGTQEVDHDVDVAVIVRSELNDASRDELTEIGCNLGLQYDKYFDLKLLHKQTFDERTGFIPYYQNIRKDGIVLWKNNARSEL